MTTPDAMPERNEQPIRIRVERDARDDEIRGLRTRLRQIEAERDKWHNLVKSLCDEWNDECPPGCDSYAHEDDCGATSITVAMRKRGEEIAALRAEVAALVELVRDFAYSPVEFDARKYLVMQVDHHTVEEARAVLDRLFKEAK